jgi:hypothetical protein
MAKVEPEDGTLAEPQILDTPCRTGVGDTLTLGPGRAFA